MDTKRLIIALALSLVVLFGWSYLFPPEEPTAPPPAPAAAADAKIEPGKAGAASAEGAAATPGASAAGSAAPAQGKAITVKTPLYTAVFNTQGGVLESMVLGKFRESITKDSHLINIIGDKAKGRAAMGVILLPAGGEVHTWNSPGWTYEGAEEVTVAAGAKQTLVFSGEAAGLKLTRKLTIHADTYLIGEELTVANPGTAAVTGKVAFTAASAGLSPAGDQYNTTRIAYGKLKGGFDEVTSTDDLEKKGLGLKPEDRVRWGAIESNYFLFILQPQGEEGAQADGRLKDGVFNLALTVPATFEAGQTKTLICDYFAGPADRSMLAAMPGKMADAVDYGWFHVIALPLLSLLNWFFKYVHNYGIAIILLTVLIKIIFWPLSQKSYKSMEQMKKIQPMLQKIREKYADDKEKQNAEIMQLYKTYKVNPAGGCVPMLVQIPVFFGLYKALLGSIELRHASFIPNLPFTDIVWLADLSMKDPFYITPLIMGATMFIQQKMTPTGGDPVQAKVMLFMPVIFTFMFLNFPAGLVVYWMVNNILSIAQQWWMMRKAS